MVIEHKIVPSSVGPGSYLHSHSKAYMFLGKFASCMKSAGMRFDDRCYALRFHERSIYQRNAKELRAIAKNASESVLLHLAEASSPLGLAKSDPFPWGFGPALPHEVDETTPSSGIGMIVQEDEPDLRHVDFVNRRRTAMQGYERQFGVQSMAAAEKFVRYEG